MGINTHLLNHIPSAQFSLASRALMHAMSLRSILIPSSTSAAPSPVAGGFPGQILLPKPQYLSSPCTDHQALLLPKD